MPSLAGLGLGTPIMTAASSYPILRHPKEILVSSGRTFRGITIRSPNNYLSGRGDSPFEHGLPLMRTEAL